MLVLYLVMAVGCIVGAIALAIELREWLSNLK